MIPQDVKERIDRYVRQGVTPGGFLHAVLSNDLFEAVTRADETNLFNLEGICRYVYDSTPNLCHGSPANVKNWLRLLEKYGHDIDKIPKEEI